MAVTRKSPTRVRTGKSGAPQPDPQLRAAIYVRISEDSAGRRAGVERQLVQCLEYAADKGWSVVGDPYDDNDKSAYDGRPRPAFVRLLKDAKAGEFDVVVAWATDRLYRLIDPDLGIIRKQLTPYVEIHTVMGGRLDLDTAEGMRRAQDSGSMAEYESARKGERVAARARQRVDAGLTTVSRRPFGWEWKDEDPKRPGHPRIGSREGLVICESEAVAVRQIFKMVAAGGSVRGAARWMRESGFVGTSGASPTAETVHAILTNPRYAGLAFRRDPSLPGNPSVVVGEAADGLRIVSVELFEAVKARLSDPTRRTNPGRPVATLLSGIAVCGKCTGPMNATNKHSRGVVTPTYICSRNSHLTRRRSLVDDAIINLVGAHLRKNEARLRRFATATPNRAATKAANEVVNLRERLQVFGAQAAAGELDPADYLIVARETRARLADAERRAAVTAGMPAVGQLLDSDDMVESWRTLAVTDVDAARSVMRELLDRVVVAVPAVPGHPGVHDVQVLWRALS